MFEISKKYLFSQFNVYVLTGLTGKVLNILFLFLFYDILNFKLWVSLSIAFFISVVWNFNLNQRIVFSCDFKTKRILFYAISIILSYILYTTISVFLSKFINYLIASILASILIYPLHFHFNKYISFKK